MAGRALTLKDSKHRYVLTDQYTIAGGKWHHAQQIQIYGRLCSSDSSEISRRLWCNSDTKEMLIKAVNFEVEARKLYTESGEKGRRGLEFLEALSLLHSSHHSAMIDQILDGDIIATKNTQGPLQPYLERSAYQAQNPLLTEEEIDGAMRRTKESQSDAVVAMMRNNFRKEGWKAQELIKAIKDADLWIIASQGEINSGKFPDHAFIIREDNKKPEGQIHSALDNAKRKGQVTQKGSGADSVWKIKRMSL
jgi:hypothetical protein